MAPDSPSFLPTPLECPRWLVYVTPLLVRLLSCPICLPGQISTSLTGGGRTNPAPIKPLVIFARLNVCLNSEYPSFPLPSVRLEDAICWGRSCQRAMASRPPFPPFRTLPPTPSSNAWKHRAQSSADHVASPPGPSSTESLSESDQATNLSCRSETPADWATSLQ